VNDRVWHSGRMIADGRMGWREIVTGGRQPGENYAFESALELESYVVSRN